jgi:hypothetical protein
MITYFVNLVLNRKEIVMNMPENSVTDLVNQDVCIPVGLTSNPNDDVVDTAVTYFSLVPSKTPGVEWVTTLIRTGDAALEQAEVHISSLSYQFISPNTSDPSQIALEPYQKAMLIIDIKDPAGEEWLFSGDGVEFTNPPSEAVPFEVIPTVLDGKKRLIITIDNVMMTLGTDFDLGFKYTAIECKDIKHCISPDPSISVGRRREN